MWITFPDPGPQRGKIQLVLQGIVWCMVGGVQLLEECVSIGFIRYLSDFEIRHPCISDFEFRRRIRCDIQKIQRASHSVEYSNSNLVIIFRKFRQVIIN